MNKAFDNNESYVFNFFWNETFWTLPYWKSLQMIFFFFYFHVNGRKFSKGVENTVGKGKIARYEQFLLFPQCFQKTYAADK